MGKHLTNDEYIKKVISVHNDRYDLSKINYKNSKTQIEVICKTHGSFFRYPSNFLQGIGCIKCNDHHTKHKNNYKEEFIKNVNIIHNNFYTYLKVDYKNLHTKIIITCPKHGDFLQLPHKHLYDKCGCPICGIENQKTTKDEFVKKGNKIHNNKYDYSKFEYTNIHTKSTIICKIHGKFKQSPNVHIILKSGCPKCGLITIGNKKRGNTLRFLQQVKNKNNHKIKYDYSLVDYKLSNKEVKFICPKHGIFLQKPSNHLMGKGCPRCSHNISKLEIDFLNYLKIDKRNFSLPKWKRKPVDGYDEITNTVYEYLGDYWHGNPKIFNHNKINHDTKKTFGELYENTFKVLNKVKSLGYNVKYIWETDWKKFKDGIDNQPKIISL